jgi:hypothetical protein
MIFTVYLNSTQKTAKITKLTINITKISEILFGISKHMSLFQFFYQLKHFDMLINSLFHSDQLFQD